MAIYNNEYIKELLVKHKLNDQAKQFEDEKLESFVFSEENRTLKYIEILDKTDELEETNPELSAVLQNDLEKYIEYREILDRSNFAWVESEKYVAKIKEQEQKEDIDIIVNEFQIKINALNNLV